MKDTTLISNVFIVGLLIAPLFILLVSLCKSKPTHTSLDSLSKLGQSQPRRKQLPKKHLLICGPSHSGKTALFYHLLTKEVRPTVTSQEVNETPGTMEVKMPMAAGGQAGETKSKSISIVDVPGHLHFRKKIQTVLEEAKAVVLVIDSKEKDKLFADAAEVLYDILNNPLVSSG